jgi:hypothetical protein
MIHAIGYAITRVGWLAIKLAGRRIESYAVRHVGLNALKQAIRPIDNPMAEYT